MPQLFIWRHPRPRAVDGRCIGRTDVDVDPRKLRRLARQIARYARQQQLLPLVYTSPLRRTAAVGRALRSLGFTHYIDERLLELNFGRWDGCRWADIAPSEVAQWEENFSHYAPGDGESLDALMQRVRNFVQAAPPRCLIVAHAGWVNALLSVDKVLLSAAEWPRPLRYGQRLVWSAD